MSEYTFTEAINLSTPIGGNLNGNYIAFDRLPESIKILLSNTNYVVLVRETTTTQTNGGGRTSGTMWYNKQVLGFTVEDATRDKKIQDKTAIPDTIEDPSTFNGIPSSVYTIRLTNSSSPFIEKSFYNGKGMVIESKSAKPNSRQILESDFFSLSNFTTGNVAFDGVFIHGGSDEGWSSGCIIFSNKRNSNKTLLYNDEAVKNLNKYLQSKGLIGNDKSQQLVIVNLWEFPLPSPTINSSGIVINSQTNQPIEGVKIDVITPTTSSLEITSNTPSSLLPTQNSSFQTQENTSEIYLP